MNEHDSRLTFSIEESIWLNKEQEIAMITQMELEPAITIEQGEEDVWIKGNLRLIGQFEAEEREDEEQIDVEKRHEIVHHFPIDITIPLNRIKHFDDVYVQVDSFDYDLPEPSCIQLTADISISGMIDKEMYERTDEKTLEQVTNEEECSEENSTFTFVAEEVEARIDHIAEEEVAVEEPQLEAVPIAEAELELESESIEEAEERVEETMIAEEDQEEEERFEVVYEMENMIEAVEQPSEVVIEIAEEMTEEAEETKSHVNDDRFYLTKMMRDEDEQFSTWKMCIVQENESLDTIASRYELNTSQLLRYNRLDDMQVEEGQVLYIPVFAKSSQ